MSICCGILKTYGRYWSSQPLRRQPIWQMGVCFCLCVCVCVFIMQLIRENRRSSKLTGMWLFIPLLVSAAGLALANGGRACPLRQLFGERWGRANCMCLSRHCERWPWRFKLQPTCNLPCLVAKCNGNFCPVAHFIGRHVSSGRTIILGILLWGFHLDLLLVHCALGNFLLSVFSFPAILCYSQSGDDPQEQHVARFWIREKKY
jgi:hypothetical protein